MFALPTEIYNHLYTFIKSQSEDETELSRVLRNCCLVCKSFYAFFRRCLYHNLTIKVDDRTRFRLTRIARNLQKDPSLLEEVRELTFRVILSRYYGYDIPSALRTKRGSSIFAARPVVDAKRIAKNALNIVRRKSRLDDLTTILQLIIGAARLRTFTFLAFHGYFAWELLDTKTKDLMYAVRCLPSINAIRYGHIFDLDARMLWGEQVCANLESLDIRSTTVQGPTACQQRALPLHCLRELSVLGNLLPLRTNFDRSLLDFPRARAISDTIDFSYLRKICFRGYSDPSAVQFLCRLVAATAQTLEELHIYSGPESDIALINNSTPTLDLSHLCALRTFALFSSNRDDTNDAEPFQVATFLSRIKMTAASSFSLSFDCFGERTPSPFSSRRGWARLDTALRDVAIKNPSLNRIEVEIVIRFKVLPQKQVFQGWEEMVLGVFPSLSALPNGPRGTVAFRAKTWGQL